MSLNFPNVNNFPQEDPGKSRSANKIQKGFTAAYPTQPSIPCRVQTSKLIISERKGFNSQVKRFYYKKDDIPGPGFYDVTHRSPVFNSVSLSKKGTCAFPSLHARMDTIISKYPASNAYSIPSCIFSKKDFSNSCSSMFQLPSFSKVLKLETPAPNHYNEYHRKPKLSGPSKQFHSFSKYSQRAQASISSCKQRNNVCARAGFLSKTPRGAFTITETGPAPGQYNINESLVKQSPKILMSCFKSKTDRGLKLLSTGPGPGSYNPNDQTRVPRKPFFPKNAILNISSRPLSLPPKPPFPGPGQYDIVDYQGPPKHLISSASFMSNTGRSMMAPSQPGLPGPATYKPEFLGKQSFLYNEDNKWIPTV